MLSDIKINHESSEIEPGTTVTVIPCKELTPIPGMVIPINADSLNLTRLLENAHLSESAVLLLGKKDDLSSDISAEAYYRTGSLGKVIQILKLPGMGIKAIVHPLKRAEVKEFVVSNETLFASVETVEIKDEFSDVSVATIRIIKSLYNEYAKLSKNFNDDYLQVFKEDEGVLSGIDLIIANLNISYEKKQELLEERDFEVLLNKIHILLIHEIEFSKLEKKIELEVSNKIMKEQKEYFLKEKLKGIKSEIGGDGIDIAEVDKIRDMISKDMLTDKAKEKALNEIAKLKRLHSMSPEYGLIRDYLDLIITLPWKKSSETRINIETAEDILNEDHYGLKKTKERIIEFLSIYKLVDKIKGPILCLVGPAGVGKTSLGKSVARALDREYIRIALGGIHDEAEIRGHRRTYIGAMPGKIIKSIKKAGANNPLFLLDEIDKLSSDFRGDPSSALLEVLDPEQNNSFMDNYLDVEFNLSNVLFLATANDKSKIPQPLLDRMEVIDIDGYLDVEKYHIATQFLIRKQLAENGLKKDQLVIEDEVIYKIITDYTMEAGVRELERKIAKICRKAARRLIKDDSTPIVVTVANLEEFLGLGRYMTNTIAEGMKKGEVNGLAWTYAGGAVLKVETNLMAGKGKLNLTGKLGDVMKESAQAALSYIRANADLFKIDNSVFENSEIHLHFPEGGVPKDGPSAGITIVTSLMSAFKNIYVDQRIGMTGEVTIHGDVLPIGGLNAKLMAAKRARLKTVIIPEKNKKELKEIASEITDSLEIIAVNHVNQVLEFVLDLQIDKANEDEKSTK